MEINVNDTSKIVDIWLTKKEKEDPETEKNLNEIYSKYAGTKYTVAVFSSGNSELATVTSDLLCFNRKKLAQQKSEEISEEPEEELEEDFEPQTFGFGLSM